jgi:hypothetical protein
LFWRLSNVGSTAAKGMLIAKFMRTRRQVQFLFCLCLLIGFWQTLPARSQSTNAWQNAAGGLWHDPANWSLGAAPHFTNSFVTITNFNSKIVTADASTPATNLHLRNLTIWAFQNRQNTLVLTNLTARMEVTRGLTLSNGAALQIYNSDLLVDGTLGGEMTLTSASAAPRNSSVILTNGALLKIGNGPGTSSFAITNGTLRTGSDLRVGALNRSLGRLTLVGGLVDVGLEFTVGDASGSTGAVMVLNGVLQALNTNANARIGQRGVGSFVISNGLARFDDVSVGRQDGGRGSLLVAGGEFACGTLSIGRFSNSVGIATIAGGKLNVADGSLYVGREGAGTLTNSGGIITASRLLVPGATNTASGSAWFSGGEAVFTSGLSLGSPMSSGQIVVNGGSLLCTNTMGTSTAVVANGTLTVSSGRACFDALRLTNSTGQIQFLGGTLCISDLTVSNGSPFVVGDGVNPAVLELSGAASFANGIVISPNTTLAGCGTVSGGITVLPGGVNTLTNCPPAGETSIALTGAASASGGMRFSFNTDAGVSYTVEFKDDLSASAWQVLETLTGNGAAAHITNAPVPTSARFFRVRTP